MSTAHLRTTLRRWHYVEYAKGRPRGMRMSYRLFCIAYRSVTRG